MLLPSIMNGNLFDDWMGDFPVGRDFFNGKGFFGNSNASEMMKTDVKETEENYSVEIDLPGFKKEDVNAKLENGYLTVSASKSENADEKDEDGKYIRKERYSGSCSRSFYVGEALTEEDIHAKFENGILKFTLPKKEPPKIEQEKYIAIEG